MNYGGRQETLYAHPPNASTLSTDIPGARSYRWKPSTSRRAKCAKQRCPDRTWFKSATTGTLRFERTANHIHDSARHAAEQVGGAPSRSRLAGTASPRWTRTGSTPEVHHESDDDDVKEVDIAQDQEAHDLSIALGRVIINSQHHKFTAVKGNEMRGLLIDPGASSGIIGTDAPSEIIEFILKPKRLEKHIT